MQIQNQLPILSSDALFLAAADAHRAVIASALPGDLQPAGGEELAPDALLLQHLPMVRAIARRVHRRLPDHVELEDLVSAGLVGLLDAASKFDGGRKIEFRSYAQIRVRGAMFDSLRSLDWSPRELRRQGRAIAEAIRVLSGKLGRSPRDEEIAAEMGMELHAYHLMTGEISSLQVGSLHMERTEEGGDEELLYVPAPAADDPLRCCIEGQTKERLAAAIEELPEKERLVLTLYYFEELTLKEIGLTLGVVESRVSQIRTAAVRRLRCSMQQTPASHDQRSRKGVRRS